jgi:2-polyprenyl-3-methyl-5-hydroxy-6-metoxy-1,4-benzoquinol methylase
MPILEVNESVFHSRAIRSARVALEDDPEPMVQQQLARLHFFARRLGTRGRRVLDWGCGSGFNCDWLARAGQAAEVAGFDCSADAVALARRAYPHIPFAVADACDPALDLRPGHWDRILSCEVLEHVPDMTAFLANLRRHLSPDGVAFVSTPNRLVFSLGHEPSPVNREHVKELALDEFRAVLRPHFADGEVHGQRFRDPARLAAWEEDVRGKIELCRRGTRWQEKPTLRAGLRRVPLVRWAYRIPLLRGAWQTLRWDLAPRLRNWLRRPEAPYRWDDFEFVSDDLSDAVWFCAVCRP